MMGVAGELGIQGHVQLILIAVVAFAAGSALTVLLMRPLIVIITSLVGAVCVTEGAFRLTMAWPALGGPILRATQARPYLIVIAMLILAAVGSAMQVYDASGKKKKRKSSGDGD